MIERFTVGIPNAVIDDLRSRLASPRWPIGVTTNGGIRLDEVQELVRYGRDAFDWKRQQDAINAFDHFRFNGIHFIHEKSGKPPLLLLHGWPGSFVEMFGIIPLLRKSFDVIVPSLPGYGFSDVPIASGMSNLHIAERFAEFMTTLGYERFFVQGGDWGADIATWLARKYPSRIIGMHLNYIPVSYAPFASNVTADEQAYLAERDGWIAESGGYGHTQRTRLIHSCVIARV